jgi:hypothetical protein
MPPARFKDVIEMPAKVADQSGFALKFDDALATALAQAAAQNQGELADALPVLALALHRLVKKRRSPNGSIVAGAESAVSLVGDAVADAVREALESVGSDELALRKLIIPRLATWDPRSGEGGAAKRRVATAEELFGDDRAVLKPLAGALVDQRLLTCSGGYYEVAHEALLRVPPLGDLILDLRGKFVRAEMLTMEARDWRDSGRRVEWVGRTGARLRDAQALLGDADFGTMLMADNLGIAEYLAACSEKDREERELRERLDRYELASIAGETRRAMQLREVDTSSMSNPAPDGGGAQVFISASSKDLPILEKISTVLTKAGYKATSDFADIFPGEEWWKRITDIIQSSDKVLVILSPDTIASPVCMKEMEWAAETGKAIVPVLIREVETTRIPAYLARLNFIFMRDDAEFERGVPALLEVLATDLEWMRLRRASAVIGRPESSFDTRRSEKLNPSRSF